MVLLKLQAKKDEIWQETVDYLEDVEGQEIPPWKIDELSGREFLAENRLQMASACFYHGIQDAFPDAREYRTHLVENWQVIIAGDQKTLETQREDFMKGFLR
jgi:hypothetical protein